MKVSASWVLDRNRQPTRAIRVTLTGPPEDLGCSTIEEAKALLRRLPFLLGRARVRARARCGGLLDPGPDCPRCARGRGRPRKAAAG